jgi:hypothetical protein
MPPYKDYRPLAQHMTPSEDEGPRRGIVSVLFQHCSSTPFYHPNPCTLAPLEL